MIRISDNPHKTQENKKGAKNKKQKEQKEKRKTYTDPVADDNFPPVPKSSSTKEKVSGKKHPKRFQSSLLSTKTITYSSRAAGDSHYSIEQKNKKYLAYKQNYTMKINRAWAKINPIPNQATFSNHIVDN